MSTATSRRARRGATWGVGAVVAALAMELPRLANAAEKDAASPGAQPSHHGSGSTAHEASSGLKRELIAGIGESDFLKLGDKPKTVKLTVVAVYSDANYGMNFNGQAHGRAAYVVPTGWTVEVTFINPSPVPHSAIIVERDQVKKLQMGEPVFAGASTPKPVQGTSAAKETFSFVASEAGDFALACGFPTHAINGHWIAFNVRDDVKVPTFTVIAPAAKAGK